MIVTLRCIECKETETARGKQEYDAMYSRWTVTHKGNTCPRCREEWRQRRAQP